MRALALAALMGACGNGRPCDHGPARPFRSTLACEAEFTAQSARPLDSSLPGARTVKFDIDRAQGDALYFQDTTTYPLHQTFAVEHLGYPPDSPFFTEYLSPDRRFILGAVTHYEEADVWAWELAPQDSASPDMIVHGFGLVGDAVFFGSSMRFHPTSQEQLRLAADLPSDVPVVTTEEIYAGTRYQPLNLGETYGQVRLLTAEEARTEYVSPREIAVLDRVPDEVPVAAALVTEEFQTPLSHANVLAQQRGTPNMGLRNAGETFGSLEGQWVRLRVGAFDFELEPATQEDADAWWDEHRPEPPLIPAPDYTREGLVDVDDVGLDDVGAVGGKAAHFGELRDIADIRVRPGFVVPVREYAAFLETNGFADEIAGMLADPGFRGDGAARRSRLEDLVSRMRAAPVEAALTSAIVDRAGAVFPGVRLRFRSSTNAEDLRDWAGAGLYESYGGDAVQSEIAAALRGVWASTWSFRAFEEREYVGIDHQQVAMAVLVHAAYTDEQANGVAVTANVFDPAPGGEDAFYVNAQVGEVSVVRPPAGVVADQILYYHYLPNQPATYLAHSSLVPAGETVLTRTELHDLGRALDAIRTHFDAVYDPPVGYARLPMDTEWKLIESAEARLIEIKQARPYPGRGN